MMMWGPGPQYGQELLGDTMLEPLLAFEGGVFLREIFT